LDVFLSQQSATHWTLQLLAAALIDEIAQVGGNAAATPAGIVITAFGDRLGKERLNPNFVAISALLRDMVTFGQGSLSSYVASFLHSFDRLVDRTLDEVVVPVSASGV